MNLMAWDGSEKRRFVRANFPCKITIYIPQEQVISAQTENISAGGVRVIIDKELKVSLSVDLELYFTENPVKCKGRVVWMLSKENLESVEIKKYDVGIEFYRIASADRSLISKFIETLVSKEK
ncbi:MAG: PilZ domain-containing protein [Candidatus Omnitrophica bacterium]|nr:PilZ domain-containing protein [Candidatus Omnitrophota bacterium]